ncbi:MAG: hypothetical protein AMJ84_09165 [Acidithiobacillales bacterium SM23_46]|jgi:uncharacterized protein|nr:MAG: hypothetical protein AMJ84_09165 [Acidithiobacillales bacterium SM23_46]KPL27106.1 MAG: hypothetical protein AMJ72_10700 [Acidithiobacillales bacterium SM1_46]
MTDTAAATHPDYDKAITYALDRLRRELSPNLFYHCAAHTEQDVLPAVQRLARLDGVTQTEQRLLEVAAAYHDIGHIRSPYHHEAIGVEIMTEALPNFGFVPADIERLSAMVMATRMPQSPNNHLERLLADADLDGLGRQDFFRTSKALWRELRAQGKPRGWTQWLQVQLRFLRLHRYFTTTARALRDEGKQQNIALLERLIRDQKKSGE